MSIIPPYIVVSDLSPLSSLVARYVKITITNDVTVIVADLSYSHTTLSVL